MWSWGQFPVYVLSLDGEHLFGEALCASPGMAVSGGITVTEFVLIAYRAAFTSPCPCLYRVCAEFATRASEWGE
jgi:hypothetical protein